MTKSALIIEDEEILIAHYTKILQSLGLDQGNIKTARNGQAALECVAINRSFAETFPDLILLDLDMPLIDGFGFLEEFSKGHGHRQTQIIIISSTIDPNELDRAAKFGVYEYVTKPLREEVLRKMVV